MARLVLGVIAGVVVWLLVATLGNMVIRFALPGYAEVETAMRFTTAMMAARLCLGVVSSFAAGLVVAWITGRNRVAIAILAGILLVFFVPVHYGLWEKFPLWYHLAFLISLVVITPLGAMLIRPRTSHAGGEPAHVARDRAP